METGLVLRVGSCQSGTRSAGKRNKGASPQGARLTCHLHQQTPGSESPAADSRAPSTWVPGVPNHSLVCAQVTTEETTYSSVSSFV